MVAKPERKLSIYVTLAATVFVAALLAFAGSLAIILLSREQVSQQNRSALCVYVDADHNRERADIVRNEQLLYTVPEFKALINSPKAEAVAYVRAKQRYVQVRSTRPSFCARSNPVPPFPSLRTFQRREAPLDPGGPPLRVHHSR